MVEIREIQQPQAWLYREANGESEYVGRITSYAQYLDIRVQIMQAQESGYYVKFNGETVKLDRNGTEDHFPDGYFGDKETKLLLELVGGWKR